jgi:hypothetical protein
MEEQTKERLGEIMRMADPEMSEEELEAAWQRVLAGRERRKKQEKGE